MFMTNLSRIHENWDNSLFFRWLRCLPHQLSEPHVLFVEVLESCVLARMEIRQVAIGLTREVSKQHPCNRRKQ